MKWRIAVLLFSCAALSTPADADLQDALSRYAVQMAISLSQSTGGDSDPPVQDALNQLKKGHCNVALNAFARLAANNDAQGEFWLGFLYFHPSSPGSGCPSSPNYPLVFNLWGAAAEAGEGDAEFMLGSMYEQGVGVAINYAEALRLYRASASQGNAGGEGGLGHLFEQGLGVPKDYSQAARLYELAAEQGHDIEQLWIGRMYRDGRGVGRDYVRGYAWINGYVSWSGNDQAAAERDELEKLMTPEQVASAQQLTAQLLTPASTSGPITPSQDAHEIPLDEVAGTLSLPVVVDGSLTLSFTVDSGAAYVNIPADVVSTLMRTGAVQSSDFVGSQQLVLGDGSTIPSPLFQLHSVKVGDVTVGDVTASVGPAGGLLLLGQSFLSRFSGWSIDNSRHVLMLYPKYWRRPR